MSPDSILPFPDPRDAADYFQRPTKPPQTTMCPLDHWLDEALRAVPLPDGFLTRVRMLASGADASSVADDRGFSAGRVPDAGRRPMSF
jgi:hypothetical protein